MVMVDGKPAVAYYAGTLGDLMFARNTAADGSGVWVVTAVARAGTTGLRPALAVVGGKPAIAYFHSNPGAGIRLASNASADGSGSWTTFTVDTGNNAPLSLAEVGGNPAVTYRNSSLYFSRNSAADGSGTWSRGLVDPAVDSTGASSLAVSGGVPVIAYRDETGADLKFARNGAADGSGNWSRSTVESAGNTGLVPTLAVVGGLPGIAYYDQTNTLVKYAVNSVANGSGTWTVRSTGVLQASPPRLALTAVGGNPTLAISASQLTYLRASAADGSGAWTSVPLDATTTVGGSVSLLAGGGLPMMAYRDSTLKQLKFGRALAANGLGAWVHTVVDDGSKSDGFAGLVSAQTLVVGNPSLAYRGAGLMFARNGAADGSGSWNPTLVSPDLPAGISLAVIDGNPAIAYQTYVGPDFLLRFSRNDAARGEGTWTTQTVAFAGNDGVSLASVTGNPAIAGIAPDGLRFYRNTASDGAGSWLGPLVDGTLGLTNASLAVVSGRPAIAYCDSSGQAVRFARATTADGSGPWTIQTVAPVAAIKTTLLVIAGAPTIVYSTGLAIQYARNSASDGTGTWTVTSVIGTGSLAPSLAVVGGYPTISFMDYFSVDLRLARNSSADGSGPWQIFTVDATGQVGNFSSLVGLADGRAGIGYYDADDRYDLKWARVSAPQLTVEEPSGTALAQLSTREVLLEPGSQNVLTFTLRSNGSEAVQGIIAGIDSSAPDNFQIGIPPAATLAAFNDLTVCTVVMQGNVYGQTTATLRFASNNPVDNPFTVQLVARVLSVNQDTDGDGLNDSAEYQLRALGFDWQTAQPQLVAALQSGANAAGYYTANQVQSLYPGSPLLQRNAATGQFLLRFGLWKSTNLQTVVPFPFVPGQTSINGTGELEFLFTVPDNTAFFRLEAQP